MAKLSLRDHEFAPDFVESERRSAERAELMVQIDYSTVDEIFSEFTRDINEGGLFIETQKPKPIGTEVALYFNLPGDGGGIETTGRVVRTTEGDAMTPPGMGVEFDDLTAQDRAKIDRLVRTLRTGNHRH
jgi:uncharacterized protein (TIGR02266 family)